MIDQLKKISENFAKAAEMLEKTPSFNPEIQHIISENSYEVKRLESFSEALIHNIKLTSKSTQK